MKAVNSGRQAIVIMLSLLLSAASIHGQERTLKVWEGKIPGAIDNPSYKTRTIYIEGNKPRLMRVTDPTLDFYPAPPEKSNASAIIICPGGGYGRLAIDHEGSQAAAWFHELGIAAFVLKYRLPNDSIMVKKSVGPLQDAQEAVRIVRRHSGEWNIDPQKIGIMGFSAGGHLASTLSTHFEEKVYDSTDSTSARPDFSILIYPVISMDSAIAHRASRNKLIGDTPSEELVAHFSNERCVGKATPPTFIVHAADDSTVPVQNSIRYMLALKQYGVPCELHMYETGGHGFGLGRGKGTESTWPAACRRWLQARGIL